MLNRKIQLPIPVPKPKPPIQIEVIRFLNRKARDHYYSVMHKPQGFIFEKHEEAGSYQILVMPLSMCIRRKV